MSAVKRNRSLTDHAHGTAAVTGATPRSVALLLPALGSTSMSVSCEPLPERRAGTY